MVFYHKFNESWLIYLGSANQAWSSGWSPAVGYHLGYHDHVLVSNPTTLSSNNSNKNSISYGTSYVSGTAAFRIPWGLQMIPAVLLFFGMMLLPESPRWLARKDRWEDCLAVLTLVHGKGDPNAPFVLREYEEIKAMCEFERENADVSYLELLKPNMINRTHVGVFTQIWSQLTGMNVVRTHFCHLCCSCNLTSRSLFILCSFI
jgi:hypothetical protein